MKLLNAIILSVLFVFAIAACFRADEPARTTVAPHNEFLCAQSDNLSDDTFDTYICIRYKESL